MKIPPRYLELFRSDYVVYLSVPVVRALVSMLILVPVTTYYLDPDDFGLFALLMGIALPIKAFASSGSRWMIGGNYLESNDERRRSLMFTVLVFELGLRTLFVLVYVVLAEPLLGLVMEDPGKDYVQLFYIGLAAIWFNSLWSSVSFLMTVLKKPRLYAGVSFLQVGVSVVSSAMFLWWMGMGVEALFYALLVTNISSFLLELRFIRHFVGFSKTTEWVREILVTALRSVPGGAAELINTMAERVFIQRYIGLSELGVYSHSQQYQSIFKMANGAFGNALTPRALGVYSVGDDPEPLERALSAWYGVLAIAGVGVVVFTEGVIRVLTHGKFEAAAPLVAVWFLLAYSVSHGIPYAQFLMAKRHTRVLMYTQMIPSLLGSVLIVIAASYQNIMLVAFSVLITSATIQLSRRQVAIYYGYRPLAERAFLESIGLFCTTWVLFTWASPHFLMGLLVFVSMTLLVYWRFSLRTELPLVLKSEK